MNFLRKHSSLILTGLSVIGVVAGVCSAIHDTKKIKEEDTTKEKIKKYIPTISIGVGTISCIIGLYVTDEKKQTSYIAAFNSLNAYHELYRQKVEELYGEGANHKVIAKIIEDNPSVNIEDLDDGDIICYDEITGKSIIRKESDIISAETTLNSILQLRQYVTVTDYCNVLGMIPPENSDILGWDWSNCEEINIECYPVNLNDEPSAIVLTTTVSPEIIA